MRFDWERRHAAAPSALKAGLVSAALGAAALYWLDPQSGARRRAGVGQKAVRAAAKARRAAAVSARDFAHRSGGLAARMRNQAVDAIAKVRGVREIDDGPERYDSAGNIPELQGGAGPRGERLEFFQQSWSPAARTLAGTTGVALLIWGAAVRSVAGAGAGVAGAGLLLRSLTNLPAARLVGIGAGPRAIDVQKAIYIDAHVEEVFGFFNRFENFPRIMSHVREVVPLGDSGRRWRWSVDGPAGLTVSWDAEVTQYERNRVIAWKSLGSLIRNDGIARFEPDGNGTRLRIRISYNPPGGAMGHAIVTALGANPDQQLDQDLLNFKSFLESGRTHATRNEQPVRPL